MPRPYSTAIAGTEIGRLSSTICGSRLRPTAPTGKSIFGMTAGRSARRESSSGNCQSSAQAESPSVWRRFVHSPDPPARPVWPDDSSGPATVPARARPPIGGVVGRVTAVRAGAGRGGPGRNDPGLGRRGISPDPATVGMEDARRRVIVPRSATGGPGFGSHPALRVASNRKNPAGWRLDPAVKASIIKDPSLPPSMTRTAIDDESATSRDRRRPGPHESG